MNSRRVQTVLTSGRAPAVDAKMHIDVPGEIYEWKAAAPTRSKALAVQDRNRAHFTEAFGGGLSVLGYERDARGDGRFLLGAWDEPAVY